MGESEDPGGRAYEGGHATTQMGSGISRFTDQVDGQDGHCRKKGFPGWPDQGSAGRQKPGLENLNPSHPVRRDRGDEDARPESLDDHPRQYWFSPAGFGWDYRPNRKAPGSGPGNRAYGLRKNFNSLCYD